MTPPLLPAAKYLVRSMSLTDAQTLTQEALILSSAVEIEKKCVAFYRAHMKSA